MSQHQSFSYTKGYSFHFEEQGHQIEAWFSCLSGREKIFVDGELICEQRSLSRHATTEFTVDGQTYTLSMDVDSLLTGPYVCTLSKNDQPLKRQKLVFPEPEKFSMKLSSFKKLWPATAAGAIAGFTMASGLLTIAETIGASIAVLIPWALLAMRNGVLPHPVIEEEPLDNPAILEH